MADKTANEIVKPSCSNYEVTDTELITGKNRKRELSISESEFEYNDYTDISKCESSAIKNTPCKDNQSNAICKRISEQSLSDAIQKLTEQIEYIEKSVALSQNFMKNTEANDEPIYQPPNKIIKYDVEVISAESCNSDENSTRSIKNINTTKHANKKIKLDKNIIFQKDIDDSERDCKSLNNEEVKMLLELPYNFDDKIVFDDEDNTHIKIHDGQTNEDLSESMRDSKNILEPIDNYCMNFESLSSQEKICFASPHDDASTKSIPNKKLIELRGDSEKISDSDKTTDKMYIDSVNIPDLAGTQNTSIKHLFNESVLDDMKIDISTEDNSMSQCNDCSENSINQSEKFVNVGDVLVLVSEMCDDDVDNCNDPESIDQDGIVDLTNCENDEMMLNHENCTSIINKGLNSTTLFDYVNSEIQTYCEETTHCSDNTIHITDFESIIVPEGKLNDSTKHVDDQEYVCKTQSNQEKNNFESSNLEDDLFGDDILDVHSKVDYCENNLNQQSLLDTDANNHTILENKNSTSEINPGQKNESTLQRLTVQEEEMLTKLFNNDVDELGIVTDCTDNSLLEVNKCEANASKISERKRHFTNDEALIMPVDVSEDVNYNGLSHNCGMEVTLSKMNPDQRNKSTLKTNAVEEEKMLTKLVNKEDDELRIVTVCTDKITTAQTYENVSKKFKNQDDLLEATLHISDENASITCEEESCRDVSVHTIHSLDGYEVNCSKNNDTVPSMENNDSLVPLNNALENSTVEICNGEIETLLGMKNKNDNYEEEIIEGIIKQIIEDITVSLDSSNTFHHVLKNIRANDFENILAPVDESNMNSESLTAKDKMGFGSYSNTNSLNKLPRTGSETYEYNHNIDASTKSIPNKKLIELRGDSEKISDSDKTTDKMYIDSVNIPDLAGTQNTSIKHLFNESVLDDMKIDISTEDNSMSQCNDCSENSINQSEEFVNVGDVLVLMSEMCDDDVDNCNDPESIDQDGIVDLTNCENDEMMLNHENCTSIINKGLNSTMPFDDVNSEIQTYCEETTHCSDNTIHITDFERIIVPEGKLNDSTKHVDDQEYVCKTQSNQEKNNFESSNIEDDLFGDDILEVHSKVDYCENNLNQQSLLDTDANNHTILENKNSTSEINPGQKNESTLQRLTVQEEEMLTQLFNNDVDELGIVTDCTDNSLVEVNKCEANASKISERKRHFTNDETLIMPVDVSEDVNYNGLSHNCGMEVTLSKMNPDQRNKSTLKTNAVEEEKMLTKLVNKEDDELRIVTVCTDKITTAQTCEDYIFEKNVINDEVSEDLNSNSAIDATTVINYDVALSERNFQGSVTGDQFMFNTFYFGTENCRDVSVHTIHSLDGYEMNCSKNNDTVPSMENNDSLVPLNNALENSTVEICNGEIETLLGMKNKNDNYEEEIIEGIIKQIIEDITVSLDSSNTFHHVLKNMRANDFENILAPVDESNMNSESLTAKDKMGFGSYSNTNSLNKLPRTGSETYEYNHNIDASTKSIPNKKLIELRGDSEKISDSDKTTDKIIDSVNIPDLAGTQNTSIKHLFNESVLDDMKIDISTEDNSMSQCNDCSENSINQSEEFVNVGDVLVLMSEMCDDDVDNCNDPESIDQDGIVDLTNCENDEMMLNHKNCTSIINKGLNSTMPFDDVNSEIQTYCEETTHCSDNTIHITDFESIIVPEGKLNDSTKHVDDQEYVCKTQSNQEKNNFESSNLEDDLFGDDILDVHSKVDYCENNLNQQSLLDTDANNHTILENKNSTSEINPGQKNESTLQRLTVQEEEMLTKLFNNDVDELGIVTDCTDNSLVEVNKCEANASKISERKRHFTNDEALIMPVDVSEDVNYNGLSHNCGMEVTLSKMNPDQRNKSTLKTNAVEEEKMLTKLVNKEDDELRIVTVCTDKITTAQTYENVSKKFKNQDDLLEATLHISDENASITCEEERHLSFISSDARQILESSNDSEHLDDSLLFKPSDRDLVRYGIECGEYEKSISQSLNNLENNASNKEVISQCKSPSLRFNEISKSINNLLSSSYAKDYEDNVIDFYDCDLSSIENSDIEDNLLLSFENDSSIDDCIFNEKKEKLKHTTNSTSNEHICKNSLKIQNVGSPSESCNNSTNVLETPVSLINLPSHDHQYNKIMSTSMSIKQIGMNPDANDKFESFNHSDVKITTCNTIPSFYESDNINKIESDDLCKDQGELKCNSNDDQNLEVSNENHNQNNKNKSISEYNTHQNIEKSQNPYKDNGSENAKLSSMKNTENEEIPNINTVPSTSSDTNQSLIEKKKYLEEIINNEQLFNKFDEKLDINESTISPYISQSLVKSTNLKNALAKRAAANINIHEMGIKALSTYLTQQTMTLDVLKVLHKSLETFPSSGVFMEDPDGLLVPLMPHQKHAIAWLIWRESQEPRGGILADDMGLGKTLSMISLILKLKEKPQDSLLPLELTISIDNRGNEVIIGGTLVVCPASLINQWETEVKSKLKPGLLKVGQYYGIHRNFSALELAENDLVITSYNVVMWDHKLRQNTSPLYKIKWDRVILDEGHNIRNHKTQTSVAVCNIKSLNRWAITGTPIHNKEADFFTLLKFVQCKPFDDWPVWKRWVGNNDDAGKHRLSLLVKTLMLRRTKTELTQFTTFNLPTKKIITIEIELSKAERNAYERLLQFSSNLFATYLYDRAAKEKLFDPNIKVQRKIQYFQEQSQDKEDVFKDHLELLELFKKFKNINEIQTYHILVLLLRLRQMCCHPILIKGPITEDSIKKEDNMESILEDDTDATYNDLNNENKDIDTSPNNIDLPDNMSCLILADEPVEIKSVIDRNIFQKTYVSSKIKKICDLVNQKLLINGGNDKAIIVSQWPSFLYLIQKNLAHYNAKIEMFSGAIPIPRRNKIIRDFNNPDGGPRILLLSLKAGGVGLNLMAANHMFLIDVHWNPQLEAQACDRVHRVGQTKPVYIYKFISNNTIETRILNIQTLKLQIAENLFKGTSVASSKLTIDDLKQIFQFH